MASKKTSTVSVRCSEKIEKKSVVRFNADTDDVLSNVYVTKDALAKIGNPDAITITISAA